MQYPNGDFYDYESGIMYYADGTAEFMESPPPISDYGTADTSNNTVLANQAATVADDSSNLKGFSDGLMQLGYTAAQLVTLYQNVESSKKLTPVALTNLQQERASLQQQNQQQNTMWLGVAVAVGLVFVFASRR